LGTTDIKDFTHFSIIFLVDYIGDSRRICKYDPFFIDGPPMINLPVGLNWGHLQKAIITLR